MAGTAPPVEAVDASRIRAVSSWDVRPWRTCAQPPEYAVQNAPVIDASLAAHFGRKKRFNHRPFEIRQIKARHHCLQSLQTVNHKPLKSKTILWVCDLGRADKGPSGACSPWSSRCARRMMTSPCPVHLFRSAGFTPSGDVAPQKAVVRIGVNRDFAKARAGMPRRNDDSR